MVARAFAGGAKARFPPGNWD